MPTTTDLTMAGTAEHAPLADKIFEGLVSDVVTGKLAPGDAVPTEHELAQTFGVNRHVVREALQRLEQLGLVKTARGGRTRVLDYLETAGLDLLAAMGRYAREGDDTLRLWIGALQMRTAIAADIARLCAQRNDLELARGLLEISERMRREADDGVLLDLTMEFWDAAIVGSDNVAYRLAANTLRRAFYAVPELTMRSTRYELEGSDFNSRIVDAIAAGDPQRADRETRYSMNPIIDALAAALERSHKQAGETSPDAINA